jgi:hypothetical protein
MTIVRVFPRSLLLVLLAAGCASEAPRAIQIICLDTPAYSSRWGSESTSSVFLGNGFQVEPTTLSRRLRITGAQGDTGGARFLDANCVAPFPLQGQARWIQTPTPATARAEGLVSRPAGSGWEMGDQVEALTSNESWVPPGQTALLAQGTVIGFVPTTALGEKPPAPESYTQALHTQLSGASFAQALSLTRRALGFFPQEVLFQRLLGHLVTLDGGKPPKPPKALPKLAALPDVLPEQPLVLSQEEETNGEQVTVFASAVGLRIREAADPSSKVLATVNVNQPLGLSGPLGDWAQVNFYPGHQLKTSYLGELMEFVDVPAITGYVSPRFLSRSPLDAGQLITRGQEALKAGRSAEAIVLMHRALEAQPDQDLGPSNAAYTGLVQASFDNGRFENLFQSIASRQQTKPSGTVRVHPDYPVVLFGCHGNMAQAKILDLSDDKNTWAGLGEAAALLKEPHLCIGGVDTREPIEPQIYCQDGECPPPYKLTLGEELYEKTLKPEYERWHDRVESHFNSPSYFFFEPKTLGIRSPGKRLVFYDIPLSWGDLDEENSGVKLKKSEAHVAVLDIPAVTDWNQLQVWIELPNYLDSEFGLALVDTEDQVNEWIQQREDSFQEESFRVPEGRPYSNPGQPANFPVVQRTSLTTGHDWYWWGLLPK